MRRSIRLAFTALVLPAALALTACAGAHGDNIPASVSIPLAETESPMLKLGELIYRGGLHLRDQNTEFGGLSSLRVSPDGSQFVAISDRGSRVAGRLHCDPHGALSAADGFTIGPLLDVDGGAVGFGKNDSEGLAIIGDWPGEGWVVSFERDHRLLRYPSALTGVVPQRLEGPAGLADLDFNSGIETLLTLDDGRLFMLAEGGDDAGRHQGWVGRSGAWQHFTYQGLPPFLPVDAARLPDGGVLVLERRVGLLGGWGNRIVHIEAASLKAGAIDGGMLEGREIARLNPPVNVDNFEGIDVRRAADGRLLVYILSDNNFLFLQRTLMMMFEWPGK
ncbi:esterase-like activity of phytase family protein [Niveispirillum irakense]|uniref:esterase-like activity of phytase family protein n=1 Tax=Niveispirillum irakense TaxID=34011 RepID=UPI000401ECF8|nr:esterase-like activity of phytase family protein [Niveispirillum irakense]